MGTCTGGEKQLQFSCTHLKANKLHKIKKNMGKAFKVYDIHCGRCGTYVLTYHKHGSGKGIIRLYLHNIIAPSEWANLQNSNEKGNKLLQCTACSEVLGKSVLDKGNKWAFRMKRGLFHRKLKKA